MHNTPELHSLARAFRWARLNSRPKFSPLEWCLSELVLLASLSRNVPRATLPGWEQLPHIARADRLAASFAKLLAESVLDQETQDKTVTVLSPKLWKGRVAPTDAPAAQLWLPAEADSSLSYAKGEVSVDLHAAAAAPPPPPPIAKALALAFSSGSTKAKARAEAKATAAAGAALEARLGDAIGSAMFHPRYGQEWRDWLAKRPHALEFALAEYNAAMTRPNENSRPTNAPGYIARIVRRYPS